MTVFKEYAELYDLFYSNKDYTKECRYILDLAAKYSRIPVKSILDIGCGTGGHALIWAKDGIGVTGVDQSPEMIGIAIRKAKSCNLAIPFAAADIRNFGHDKIFSLAVAMFAVMGYQTGTDDIISALSSVRRYLDVGGLFIFDVWSGPAVLSSPPREKISYYSKGDMEIIRTVRPEHHIDRHVINVRYDILCIEDNRLIKRIRENHFMRYYFPLEVDDFASRCGFKLVAQEPFLRQNESLTLDDWNATYVLEAV